MNDPEVRIRHLRALDDDEAPSPRVRVLVALGINPYSERLLRTAARLAEGLGGDLHAVHIALRGHPTSLYEANLSWHIDQARQLGAHVEIVDGDDVATTLVRYAQRNGVTHIVLGQSDVSRWHEITRGSIVTRMQRMVLHDQLGIDLYIVTSNSAMI